MYSLFSFRECLNCEVPGACIANLIRHGLCSKCIRIVKTEAHSLAHCLSFSAMKLTKWCSLYTNTSLLFLSQIFLRIGFQYQVHWAFIHRWTELNLNGMMNHYHYQFRIGNYSDFIEFWTAISSFICSVSIGIHCRKFARFYSIAMRPHRYRVCAWKIYVKIKHVYSYNWYVEVRLEILSNGWRRGMFIVYHPLHALSFSPMQEHFIWRFSFLIHTFIWFTLRTMMIYEHLNLTINFSFGFTQSLNEFHSDIWKTGENVHHTTVDKLITSFP